MKKTLSMVLAILMALSVFSGISVSAYAEDNSAVSVEYTFKNSTIYENTCGYWDLDKNENPIFIYYPTFLFTEGDTITVKMKDGSSVVYTFTEYPDSVSYPEGDLLDKDGNALDFGLTEFQYENPWRLGDNVLGMYLYDYDITVNIPVKVIAGSEDTCWHSLEWQIIDGKLMNKCYGCNHIEIVLPFTDLYGCDYYADFIVYTSYLNNFLKGTNPPEFSRFSPEMSITRAMLITILYRMAGEPYSDGSNPYKETPFTDITDTSVYYYDSACWALENGITTETTFKPFDNVTREQTASFLFRYADENDMLGDDEYKTINLSKKFNDADKIAPWAEEAMKWTYNNSIIRGTMQGDANPQGVTQRIHATKILAYFGFACNLGNQFTN